MKIVYEDNSRKRIPVSRVIVDPEKPWITGHLIKEIRVPMRELALYVMRHGGGRDVAMNMWAGLLNDHLIPALGENGQLIYI